MQLKSLTYSSQAAELLNDGEIERILHASRNNNALDGISGFLLYNGCHFVQVVEGTPQAIDDVMARIRADPRHRNVVVIDEREQTERVFPDWTMGYLRLEGTTSNAAAIDRALRRDVPTPVREVLSAMAETMRERP